MSKITLNDVKAEDLREFLQNNLEGMAESHIECWEERYAFKKIETIEYDLRVNHDDSLEIEKAETGISRHLTNEEMQQISELFILEVLKELDSIIE